jgi:hypothetical protein
MNLDAVALGSILSVIIAIVIVVFLAFKVKTLMARDAEKHQSEQ